MRSVLLPLLYGSPCLCGRGGRGEAFSYGRLSLEGSLLSVGFAVAVGSVVIS